MTPTPGLPQPLYPQRLSAPPQPPPPPSQHQPSASPAPSSAAHNPQQSSQQQQLQPLNGPTASGQNGSGVVGVSGSGRRRGDVAKETPLSPTNLYIRGLEATTSDEDLRELCKDYGKITSTKAILDKETGQCKGYGFVDFDSNAAAEAAVKGLSAKGVQAQMAKSSIQQVEQDPTNLYIANLPLSWAEANLEEELKSFGMVISTRILRNQADGVSRGVGFARMESKEKCEQIIAEFNGKVLNGATEPLLVKFADSGKKPQKNRASGIHNPLGGMHVDPYGGYGGYGDGGSGGVLWTGTGRHGFPPQQPFIATAPMAPQPFGIPQHLAQALPHVSYPHHSILQHTAYAATPADPTSHITAGLTSQFDTLAVGHAPQATPNPATTMASYALPAQAYSAMPFPQPHPLLAAHYQPSPDHHQHQHHPPNHTPPHLFDPNHHHDNPANFPQAYAQPK